MSIACANVKNKIDTFQVWAKDFTVKTESHTFTHQAELLSRARRALMLPHSRGEAQSIAEAFHECSLAFHEFRPDDLDDNSRRWFDKITELMDTAGIDDPAGRGTFVIKAERLTNDEKIDLSHAVDELAHWLDSHF